MERETTRDRVLAVQRFMAGERPESICTSLGKTKAWLYKWVKRSSGYDGSWYKDRSRRPHVTPTVHHQRLKRSSK